VSVRVAVLESQIPLSLLSRICLATSSERASARAITSSRRTWTRSSKSAS
jgi:hypothetical protein